MTPFMIPFVIVTSVIMPIAVVVLLWKLLLIKHDLHLLSAKYARLVEEETNALVTLASSDGDMKNLAKALNDSLNTLRKLRKQYLSGDKRLKEAVTNISHDLRTPLTAIRGYLELLNKSELSDEQRGWLAIVERRTAEISALIEELFRYAVTANREGEYNLETVNVNELLEECLISFYATFKERGLEPSSAICEKKVIRTTDRSALLRIFSNIVSNALKYAEKDFSVSMSEDGVICFSNRADALTTVDVDRLFDRYYTVKSNLNATGLGLSIARLLSENLGFSIAALHQDGELKILMKV